MFDNTDPATSWLNITNLSLGIVTVICLFVVGSMIVREVAAKLRSRVRVPAYRDNHSFIFRDLGITMADGGEKVPDEKLKKSDSPSRQDGRNIIRSNN